MLTPSMSETKMSTRGFPVKNAASQELLEKVGETFLTGYGYAMEARGPAEAEQRLEGLTTQFRGFGYEGAAMALTMLDVLPLPGSGRLAAFLAGRGRDHIYMAYVGIGWAMARLPRFRWRAIEAPDPLLRWLALDGYGFHQAYFRTQRYVHEQFREAAFPWPADDPHGYAVHAIDQGIGRAMWFACGTDAGRLARTIESFPAPRHADLYSGAGLAATYAGGADEAELRRFADRSGSCRGQLAQGSAFGAKARVRAGLVVPHTHLATKVLCGMSPERAADVCDRARPDGADDGRPAYELWRQRITAELTATWEARR
jgi:enediyne biosynthesis protein E3